jgi:hypothetical protein
LVDGSSVLICQLETPCHESAPDLDGIEELS